MSTGIKGHVVTPRQCLNNSTTKSWSPTLHTPNKTEGPFTGKYMATTGSKTLDSPEIPKDTHPPHQRTVQCRHTPPSLPSRLSSNAAGSATPAPPGFGMVNGACVEREELGRSYEPSPGDPIKRPNEEAGHHQLLLFGQSIKSMFYTPQC